MKTRPDSPAEERQRDLCVRCNRSKSTCFCGFVSPFRTRTRFVILMHTKEYKRQRTGTGRLTAMSLPNSEIIVGVDFSNDRRVNALIANPGYYPVLLFPGPSAVNLTEGGELNVPGDRTLLVFVVDGTWRLARKIVHMGGNLRGLPRICFTSSVPSRFLIKRQPREFCLSTIEAVHHLLDALDRLGLEKLEKKHDSLIGVLDKIVEFQQRCTADPSLPSFRRKKSAPRD